MESFDKLTDDQLEKKKDELLKSIRDLQKTLDLLAEEKRKRNKLTILKAKQREMDNLQAEIKKLGG